MNRPIKSVVFSLVFLSMIVVGNWPCQGQDDPLLLEAIQINFADANQILRVAASVLDASELRMEVDAQQNLIVAYGKPNTISRLKEIVAKMDAERSIVKNENQVKVFSLTNARATDIAIVLSNLVTNDESSSIHIANDPPTNSIVVSGLPEDLAMLELLIARLDTSDGNHRALLQPENVVVRLTWLVDAAEIGETKVSQNLRSPNPALNELVAGLKQSGLMTTARTVTQLQTTVQVNSSDRGSNEFSNSSMRNLNGLSHAMEVTGSIRPLSKQKYELSISLNLRQETVGLTVGSTMALPKNHPVALSFSDVGDFKSVAVVEVLDAH